MDQANAVRPRNAAGSAPALVRDPAIAHESALMADGRDLHYYDDRDRPPRGSRRVDARELDPRPATPELRRDPLTLEWVAVAAARQNRVFLPPADADPLAPQTPTNPSEIPDDYDVAVFENRTPSFGPAAGPALSLTAHGLETSAPAAGRCEVVSFSPDREGSLGTLGAGRARTVIEAWAHRTAELSAIPSIRQVFPFENRGEAIGVTLHHPHGQIYAYPYVTPRTERLLAAIAEYGPTLQADVLDREHGGPRLLVGGEHWTAYVPFAARWPIEIHVAPNRHVPDFSQTSLAERDELATLLPRLLLGVDALYDSPTPYIAAWHQAPLERGDNVRMMLQITSPRRAADRLKFLAGSEAAMGAWITDVTPESAAAALRDALPAAAPAPAGSGS